MDVVINFAYMVFIPTVIVLSIVALHGLASRR